MPSESSATGPIPTGRTVETTNCCLSFYAGGATLEELAYTEYPRQGQPEGYSYSIVSRATVDQHKTIVDLYRISLDVGWNDQYYAFLKRAIVC